MGLAWSPPSCWSVLHLAVIIFTQNCTPSWEGKRHCFRHFFTIADEKCCKNISWNYNFEPKSNACFQDEMSELSLLTINIEQYRQAPKRWWPKRICLYVWVNVLGLISIYSDIWKWKCNSIHCQFFFIQKCKESCALTPTFIFIHMFPLWNSTNTEIFRKSLILGIVLWNVELHFFQVKFRSICVVGMQLYSEKLMLHAL